jgi:hypothetical protein
MVEVLLVTITFSQYHVVTNSTSIVFCPEDSYRDVHHLSSWTFKQKQQTPWPESVSEIYRPSDRRLSAKLVPTSADRGCHVVSMWIPTAIFSDFKTGVPTFSSK